MGGSVGCDEGVSSCEKNNSVDRRKGERGLCETEEKLRGGNHNIGR